MRRITFRGKLLISYVALAFLGMGLLATYLLWSFHHFFLQSEQRDLADRATAVSISVQKALQNHDYNHARDLVQRHAVYERLNIRVFRTNGTLLATSSERLDARIQNWWAVPGLAEALQGPEPRSVDGVEDVPNSPLDELYAVRPMFDRDGVTVLGVLRMSLRLADFQRLFERLIQITMISLGVALAVCTALSFWWSRTLTEPIHRMRDFAVRVGGGHFGEELEVRQGDEVGELADSLNRMSQRLASIEDERRSFLANVSHELRTPVSNVRLTLEALQDGAVDEPELRERFVRTSLEETNRLARLIGDLLELGRLEAGVVKLDRQSVRVRELAQRCARAMETRARAKGLRVRVDVPDVRVHGDPERLLQALLNVLDNAIKHSTPESTVLLTGKVEGGQALLAVKDQGPGIQEADLPRVFDQFYAADPSRKRGGTGLGLTIARRIVEAHGGSISVASQAGNGATFSIRLPLEAAGGTARPTPPFTRA